MFQTLYGPSDNVVDGMALMLLLTYHFILVTVLVAIATAFCLSRHSSSFSNLQKAAEAFVWLSAQPHEQRQAHFLRTVLRAINPEKLRTKEALRCCPDWLPVLPSDPHQWLDAESHLQSGQPRISARGPPWKWWFRLYSALIAELQWTWRAVQPVLLGLAIIWFLTLFKVLSGIVRTAAKNENFNEALKQATPSIVVFTLVFGIPLLLNIFVSCLVNDAIGKCLDVFNGLLMREEDLQYLLRARRDPFQLRLLTVPMNMNVVKTALVTVVSALASLMSQ